MSKNKCDSCIHWMNKQRDLNYSQATGYCTNDNFKFNTINGRFVGVIDRGNLKDRTKVTGNPSHDFEGYVDFTLNVVERYSLVTSDQFGCIFHNIK